MLNCNFGPMGRLNRNEVPLIEAYDRARERWKFPGVSLAQFRRHIGDLGYVDSLPPWPDEVYLCAGCALGLRDACRIVDEVYLAAARPAMMAVLQHSADVDDVLQDVRQRLLAGPSPKIATYRGSGPISAWVRIMAVRAALDNWRSRTSRECLLSTQQRHYWLVSNVSTERIERPVRNGYSDACAVSLRASVAALPPEARQLLVHHFAGRLSIDILARMYAVDRSTVARRIQRSIDRIRRRLAIDLRRQHKGLTNAEALEIAYDELRDDPPALLDVETAIPVRIAGSR